jgi:hypothetical protein
MSYICKQTNKADQLEDKHTVGSSAFCTVITQKATQPQLAAYRKTSCGTSPSRESGSESECESESALPKFTVVTLCFVYFYVRTKHMTTQKIQIYCVV